jgi:hypothetical protein
MLFFIYYATPVLYYCNLWRHLVPWCKGDSVRIMCVSLASVSMNCWCLLEPSSTLKVIVWGNLVWGNANFEECFVALRIISVRYPLENSLELHTEDSYLCVQLCYLCWESPLVKVWSLGLVSKHWNIVYIQFCYMFARSDIYFRLHLLLIIIHNTCISLSLRRTSAPIHLTSVLGVLGTQETSCIIIAGLLERGSFDLLLPEIDKPLVIHLRDPCFCSTNLCTWRPNTVYKNRRVCRHHYSMRDKLNTTLLCFSICLKQTIDFQCIITHNLLFVLLFML